MVFHSRVTRCSTCTNLQVGKSVRPLLIRVRACQAEIWELGRIDSVTPWVSGNALYNYRLPHARSNDLRRIGGDRRGGPREFRLKTQVCLRNKNHYQTKTRGRASGPGRRRGRPTARWGAGNVAKPRALGGRGGPCTRAPLGPRGACTSSLPLSSSDAVIRRRAHAPVSSRRPWRGSLFGWDAAEWCARTARCSSL